MAGARIDEAEVDWAGDAPRSIFFDDIYFSGDGLEEARHVFVRGAGLETIFSAGGTIAVGELGFGAGLNFLAACEAFDALAPSSAHLDFFSVEMFPLSQEALARVHRAWPSLGERAARLRAVMPAPAPGFHRARLDDRISLTLAFADAHEALFSAEGVFDAFFLDGFAPARNPQMWTPAIFAELFRLMKPGACAATFTVAGDVRRGLSAAGFSVEKRPGFGAKREMTAATRRPGAAPQRFAPWYAPPAERLAPGARVAIIGGGVAGAAMAGAAARRGFSPVIVEKQRLAAGASGNPAGLIMPRLDLGDAPLAGFWRNAYLYALRLLNDPYGDQSAFRPCGVLLMARNAEDRLRHEKLIASGAFPPGYAEKRGDHVFFPQGGVVDPARWTQGLAAGAAVMSAQALFIAPRGDGVRIHTDRGDIDAAAAVIAAGADARRFAQLRACPLDATAGQIDWFANAPALAFALAGGAYAAPAPGGGVMVGATYVRGAGHDDPAPHAAATAENLSRLAALDPSLAAQLSSERSLSRAARRAVAPDHAPYVGPAPDIDGYGALFDDLRFGRERDWPSAPLCRRVFILGGLGSRGLVTAPLAAELLSAMLAGAPLPTERGIVEALHPARFFIRDLRRASPLRKK